MSNSGFNLLGILIIVVMLIFGVGISCYSLQSRRRAWSELAARTGLTFESGSFWGTPTVTGTYRGLTLDTFTRSSGKSSTTYTRIVLFVNNQANLYLAMYEETIFSKIGKFFGTQDIQIGDDEFDRRFMIKGQPEEDVTRLLNDSTLRTKIMAARSLNIEVDGRELHFEERYVNLDLDYTQSLFDLLTDIAVGVEQIEARWPLTTEATPSNV